jgi:hypothetical protein
MSSGAVYFVNFTYFFSLTTYILCMKHYITFHTSPELDKFKYKHYFFENGSCVYQHVKAESMLIMFVNMIMSPLQNELLILRIMTVN